MGSQNFKTISAVYKTINWISYGLLPSSTPLNTSSALLRISWNKFTTPGMFRRISASLTIRWRRSSRFCTVVLWKLYFSVRWTGRRFIGWWNTIKRSSNISLRRVCQTCVYKTCVPDVCVQYVCVQDVCVQDVCARRVCTRRVCQTCVYKTCVPDVCVQDVCAKIAQSAIYTCFGT
jgi:hypothetical protein